jgi:hypothetical protein
LVAETQQSVSTDGIERVWHLCRGGSPRAREREAHPSAIIDVWYAFHEASRFHPLGHPCRSWIFDPQSVSCFARRHPVSTHQRFEQKILTRVHA